VKIAGWLALAFAACTSATAFAAPPTLGLAEPSESTLPPPPQRDAPAPLALDHAFEPLPLPADAPEIVAVDGRDERDVWLLGADGKDIALFHWDGAKLEKKKTPQCKENVAFVGLALAPDATIALARSFEVEGGSPFEAKLGASGGWSCERAEYDAQLLRVGSELLRFESLWRLTLGGNRLPLPGFGMPNGEIAGRSAADLWLYFPGNKDVLHSNGVAWEARPTGLAMVKSLRTDEKGAAWLVGGTESGSEGNVILHWESATHAWKRLPTPADLRASRIRVASERDAWTIGKEHVHHWDGASLRRGKNPLKRLGGAWLSPAGELWLAGGDDTRPKPSRSVAGVVFRMPAGRKP